MNVGVVGLGLIGGSFAKALKSLGDVRVLGFDINETTTYQGLLTESIDAELTSETLPECDVVLLALYPSAALDFVKRHEQSFKRGCVVADLCGVKRAIFDEMSACAEENGLTYIGTHPMAGRETSGFESSDSALFTNASLILTPMKSARIEEIGVLKTLAERIGFNHFEIASPDEHDEIIAFTSQLAHVVSSAYIKSPTAERHKGFSAGSYKDMTRVARLNEAMWTELFLDNADNLAHEVDHIIQELEKYQTALNERDEATLFSLLREGRIRKENIDC